MSWNIQRSKDIFYPFFSGPMPGEKYSLGPTQSSWGLVPFSGDRSWGDPHISKTFQFWWKMHQFTMNFQERLWISIWVKKCRTVLNKHTVFIFWLQDHQSKYFWWLIYYHRVNALLVYICTILFWNVWPRSQMLMNTDFDQVNYANWNSAISSLQSWSI